MSNIKYEEFELSRPKINADSLKFSICEVTEASLLEDIDVASRIPCGTILVAATIHEFSKMINEHIAEFYRRLFLDK